MSFATDMQTSAITDSRSSRAVWAEVHVKERRAAAHASSRALGLPEAVPVEVTVEVGRATERVWCGREAEVDLVRSAVSEARMGPVAVVEEDEVAAAAIDLAQAREEPEVREDRALERPEEALDAAVGPRMRGPRERVLHPAAE
jgi:hypothetical protein